MDFDRYQWVAVGTAGKFDNRQLALAVWALGIAGEAGEVAELVKKHLGHGHVLDTERVTKELGDVLWYVAVLARELGISLNRVAAHNLKKLRERYPKGFSHERSKNRKAEDL